jgi:hypothetical protein
MGEAKKKQTKKATPAKAKRVQQKKPATELKAKGPKVEIEVELPLSDKEKVKRGQLACQLLNEKADIELEKKKANDRFKEEMNALGSRAHKLLREFETGREKRKVSATEIRNFAKNVVEYSYQGKIVQVRAMTAEDRQEQLPLKEKKTTAQKATAVQKPAAVASSGPTPEAAQAPTPPAGDPSLQPQLPLTAPLGEISGKVCAAPAGKPNPKAPSETEVAIADEDIAATMRAETSRRTKLSAVDGARA